MPSLHTRLITVIGLGAVAVAGCPGLRAGDVPDSEVQRRIEAREGASQRLPERMLETSPPVTGEAPTEFVEDVREDVARRTSAATADLRLVRDQAIIWSDGSLGCPQPGEVYPQLPIAGYWIVYQAAGRDFDYRVDDRGRFRLCEARPATLVPSGNPGN
jgi:hypothetical protein